MKYEMRSVMGEIGDDPEKIEIIPKTRPRRIPRPAPRPAPVPVPEREPEEVPA
jgi:hypothetical protein